LGSIALSNTIILNRRKKWRYGNVVHVDMKKKVVVNPGSVPNVVRQVLFLRRKSPIQPVAAAVVPVNNGGKELDHGGMQQDGYGCH